MPRHVQALLNGIDVLHVLRASSGPQRVTTIAGEAGLSKSTVHTILQTLELRHLVRKSSAGLYSLGWGLFALGQGALADSALLMATDGELDALAERTGETALLGICDDAKVLYVDIAESPRSVRLVAKPGTQAPLHATATGKLLMAAMSAPEMESLGDAFTEGFTASTVTGIDKVREEVAKAQRDGFATCLSEYEIGESSVAVPINDGNRVSIAALTLAGPAGRLDMERMTEYLPIMKESATRISSRMRHLSPSNHD